MSESGRPLKRFSQNFLTNPQIQQSIVQALHIQPDDRVMEIGPGKGALTLHIIQQNPSTFLAVEIDTRWADFLESEFQDKVEIIREDFLSINLSKFHSTPKLKIIGNLPYHITSPILFQLINHFTLFDSAVLMVQKEVAKRIVAKPSSKDYGIPSVLSQTYAEVEYLFDVKPGNFFPVPAVDSAVFRLKFFNEVKDIRNISLFRKIVRSTFNTRRKMLRNSLSRTFDKSAVYSLTSVDLNRRPEELTVQDFKNVANELENLLAQARDEH